MEPQVRLKYPLSSATALMCDAARLCYGHEDDITPSEQVKLLRKILNLRHFSILEHASASFLITGVTRNLTHQLVRHRHMSFAQQSFHYTIAKDRTLPIFEKPLSSQAFDKVAEAFDGAFEAYKALLAMGVPREDARHVLPTGMPTKIMATANLREWMQFVQIRACSVNCAEIRSVAEQVRAELVDNLPFMRPWLGPACLYDQCHEGARSCGKRWTI